MACDDVNVNVVGQPEFDVYFGGFRRDTPACGAHHSVHIAMPLQWARLLATEPFFSPTLSREKKPQMCSIHILYVY